MLVIFDVVLRLKFVLIVVLRLVVEIVLFIFVIFFDCLFDRCVEFNVINVFDDEVMFVIIDDVRGDDDVLFVL